MPCHGLLHLDDGGPSTGKSSIGSRIAKRPPEAACGGPDFLSAPFFWATAENWRDRASLRRWERPVDWDVREIDPRIPDRGCAHIRRPAGGVREGLPLVASGPVDPVLMPCEMGSLPQAETALAGSVSGARATRVEPGRPQAGSPSN